MLGLLACTLGCEPTSSPRNDDLELAKQREAEARAAELAGQQAAERARADERERLAALTVTQVRDLVETHRALLRELGIERLLAAVGGSLGGMQALQWAIDHPTEIDGSAIIAASPRCGCSSPLSRSIAPTSSPFSNA